MKVRLFDPGYWISAFGGPTQNSIRAIPTELLTDALIVVYALWTIACHATVILEGDTRSGLTAAALAAALALLIAIGVLWKRRDWRQAYFADLRESPHFAELSLSNRGKLGLIAVISLVVVTWLITRNEWIVWIAIVICCTLASLYGLCSGPLVSPESKTDAEDGRFTSIVLYGAAFVCLAFTFLAFRPRSDEGFYSSMAVSIANYPDLAVNKFKMLHGPATEFLSEQKLYPPYRVHSFELLGGYLSYLLGIESIRIVHLFLAPLFAWFTPFAIARLLKLLTPRHWLAALLITLSFYFIEGSASRGFANQAFVRFFNGKSVMLTFAVPLVIAYGLRFGSKPTVSRFIMLTCSQITTVGLSSTGIWLAPLLATVSVAVALPTRRALLPTMGLSLLSSSYVLLIGLWTAGQMHVGVSSVGKVVTSAKSAKPNFGLLKWVLPQVLGKGWTVIAHLSSVALACALARRRVTWRLFAALGLVVSLGLANPFLVKLVQSYVTGRLTYERIFWLLPIPVALGVWSTGLYAWVKQKSRAWTAAVAVLIVLVGYYAVSTDRPVIGESNHAYIAFPPTIKMWRKDRKIAREVCVYARKDQYVLAPKNISSQLVTMSDCGIPLLSELRWMSGNKSEERRRYRMVGFVGGSRFSLKRSEFFFEFLKKYRISVVVTTKSRYQHPWLSELLSQAGFKKVESIEGYRILVLDKSRIPWRLRRARRVAKSVCQRAPHARFILAPFGVSRQLASVDGCSKALIAYHPKKMNIRIEQKELRRLDDLISRKGDLTKEDDSWMRKVIDDYEIGATVLYKKAFRNTKLKKLLKKLGFKYSKTVDNHILLVRKPLDKRE